MGLTAVFASLALAQTPAAPAAPQTAPVEKTPTDDVLNPQAPVAADPNALAALAKEEEQLMAQSKEATRKIVANERPLWADRQQAMAQDKDLQAISREIAAKQRELEAKFIEKYPDIGARSQESEALRKQYSAIGEKLRDVRKKMDAIRKAIATEQAEKKSGK